MTATIDTPRRAPGDYEFSFEPTTDVGLITGVVTHVSLYKHLGDDNSPPREDYRPVQHPSVLYLVVRDYGVLQGLFFFHPINSVTVEIHTCLLPHCWGAKARQIAREMLVWFWENSAAVRLVTSVPEQNRLALVFAKAAGMKEYGRNPESFLKEGKLRDLILLGISRPPKEPTCQQ